MNCRQVNRYLLDYVDDVGRQDVRNQITAHIQECNQCRANYYLAKAENEVLRQPLTLPSAPADFSEKVMRIIQARNSGEISAAADQPGTVRRRPWLKIKWLTAVVAGLAFVVYQGGLEGISTLSQPPAVLETHKKMTENLVGGPLSVAATTNGVQSESSALADNHQFFDYESTETAMGTKTVKYEGDKAAGASASNADTLAGLPFTCSDKQFSAENKQQYISQEEQVVSAQENAGEKATEAMMALEAVDLFSKEHSGHAPDSMPTTKMLAATGYQQSESPAQAYSMMQSGREGAIEAQQESEQAVAYDLLGVPEYYQCQKQEEAETAVVYYYLNRHTGQTAIIELYAEGMYHREPMDDALVVNKTYDDHTWQVIIRGEIDLPEKESLAQQLNLRKH